MATATAPQEAPELQLAIATLLLALKRQLDALWGALDITNLAETLPDWLDAVSTVIQNYSEAAGALMLEMYTGARDDAGFDDEFFPGLDIPTDEHIESVIRWAIHDLWDGGDIEKARQSLDGGAEKLVMDSGRDAIANASEQDQAVKGFVRIARPDACSFCALLASRHKYRNGAYYPILYKSAETAGAQGDGNRYHDNCRCTVFPIFTGQDYEPPEYVRAWQRRYHDSTQGLFGPDALNAFRRSIHHQRNPDARYRARRT